MEIDKDEGLDEGGGSVRGGGVLAFSYHLISKNLAHYSLSLKFLPFL